MFLDERPLNRRKGKHTDQQFSKRENLYSRRNNNKNFEIPGQCGTNQWEEGWLRRFRYDMVVLDSKTM